MDNVNASGFQQKWSLDPKGYFLIRINKEKQIIEVGHCLKNNEILKVINGKTPEEIMYKIIDLGLISMLDHAAYLGKELQKAYIALKYGAEYVQDSELKTTNKNNLIIIRHRVNTIKELLETPEELGIEIDVRAYENKLILNHEPFNKGELLKNYLNYCKNRFVIFDIKEAGIEDEVISLAESSGLKDYFLLDAEFYYIYHATRKKRFRKIAVRFSEIEPIETALAQKNYLDWVWIDVNTSLPLDKENYKKLKEAGFKLCLVCPERWGRPKDITTYINYLKDNNIKIDAVMTALPYIDEWNRFNSS